MITRRRLLGLLATAALPTRLPAASGEQAVSLESELLARRVAAGKLPALSERLPRNPRVIDLGAMGREPGQHGGSLRMLIGGQRDIRYVPINGYSRLVGYNLQLDMVPDILESFTVEDGRRFTFHLREGHKWSDGSDFTAEDFNYYWHDVILNEEYLRGGPPVSLKVNGNVARFEVLDPLTVRYTWDLPMPQFLPNLASPIPLTLALPSSYMRQFHARYQTPEKLAALVEQYRVDDWVGLHRKMSRQNRPENPDLPTLEPWRPRTRPPAEQFVFERNPYFHRVDEFGRQLPYIDRMVLNVSTSDIIAAKAATGESDLQASAVDLPDYTLIKEAEQRFPIKVSLWKRTRGSSVVLFPNLNCKDRGWRKLFQDVRMRRALSLAINRREINQVIYYGLANESANTVLPESPLYKPEYANAWASHEPEHANRLLDILGMDKRHANGMRLLPDGRLANITVESSGESTLETDVLELIRDHFREIGIALFVRTSQRDIFRSRIRGGEVMMSVWQGLDNGLPAPDMSPEELAPSSDDQLQWPLWGLHYMSGHSQGKPSDLFHVQLLSNLRDEWMLSRRQEDRRRIWERMLAIHADQVFTIGTINGTLQPVVRSARLHNLPEKGLFGFQPTSYFGAYMPDTFWLDKEI
ncbi:ABC transporter substrate-binding protein [Granulosicoccus sp. 3-233]|uniref:ABC transporter substrate-binding protein n=1 Tax=Granulosicoccus sp. 3-233 TaxID=3417969 RepID=UPI003D354503